MTKIQNSVHYCQKGYDQAQKQKIAPKAVDLAFTLYCNYEATLYKQGHLKRNKIYKKA